LLRFPHAAPVNAAAGAFQPNRTGGGGERGALVEVCPDFQLDSLAKQLNISPLEIRADFAGSIKVF